MRCNKNIQFIITETKTNLYIERRFKTGEYISSVCCKKCIIDLENAIKKFKQKRKKK